MLLIREQTKHTTPNFVCVVLGESEVRQRSDKISVGFRLINHGTIIKIQWFPTKTIAKFLEVDFITLQITPTNQFRQINQEQTKIVPSKKKRNRNHKPRLSYPTLGRTVASPRRCTRQNQNPQDGHHSKLFPRPSSDASVKEDRIFPLLDREPSRQRLSEKTLFFLNKACRSWASTIRSKTT